MSQLVQLIWKVSCLRYSVWKEQDDTDCLSGPLGDLLLYDSNALVISASAYNNELDALCSATDPRFGGRPAMATKVVVTDGVEHRVTVPLRALIVLGAFSSREKFPTCRGIEAFGDGDEYTDSLYLGRGPAQYYAGMIVYVRRAPLQLSRRLMQNFLSTAFKDVMPVSDLLTDLVLSFMLSQFAKHNAEVVSSIIDQATGRLTIKSDDVLVFTDLGKVENDFRTAAIAELERKRV